MVGQQTLSPLFIEIYKTKISRSGVKELQAAGIDVNCDYEDLSSDLR